MFSKPVSIADNPKINQWLALVEKEMRLNLASLLAQAVEGINQFQDEKMEAVKYLKWVDCYQAQLVVLASQIAWSEGVEAALQTMGTQKPPSQVPLQRVLKVVEGTLNVLADSVLLEQPPVRRKKLEHLVSVVSLALSYKLLHHSTDHRTCPSERHYKNAALKSCAWTQSI